MLVAVRGMEFLAALLFLLRVVLVVEAQQL
jgi:hypothetical protein